MRTILTAAVLIILFISAQGFAEDGDAVYRKGIGYASEGKFQEAQDWFADNLKSNKSDATSASSLAVIKDFNDGKITAAYARSFFTGLDLLQNGKIEEGVKELEKNITADPAYFRAYNVLGMVYASQGDKEKSTGYFQKAVEINPQYSQAYFNLAALSQSAGQWEEALKYYTKAEVLEPNSIDILMGMAQIYASLEKYPEAIKHYQRVIELDRNNPEAYYNLALVFFMTEQLVKFKENLLKAQALYRQKNDTQGLDKVTEYMNKIKVIESKIKQASNPAHP